MFIQYIKCYASPGESLHDAVTMALDLSMQKDAEVILELNSFEYKISYKRFIHTISSQNSSGEEGK